MNWNKLNRKIHYWGSAIIIIPFMIVLVSGLLLQVKKEVPWVQPKTIKTEERNLTLSFEQILEVSKTVEQAGIKSWKDIKLLDIRPNHGVTKIITKDNWEIQIHNKTASVLAVNIRRSDIIESIHDGSWFHEDAKLWLFLPSALIVLVLTITGFYIFLKMLPSKMRKKTSVQIKELNEQINNKAA